ncbi:MAG TPA: hypothetical protein VE282_02175 [Gemmatimonadales bacterium]|nr:hypothetical protein [Gemmatimonadales bacterium]
MLAEPPSNGEYLVAAYVVSTLILVGYWIRLWRSARKSVSGKTDSVSGNGKNASGKREGTR